ALDFGPLLLLGDDRGRLLVRGRLRLSSRLTRAAGHLADGSAQRLGGRSWEEFILAERSAGFLLAPGLLALDTAEDAAALLSDERRVGAPLERKMGESIRLEADLHVAAFRHRGEAGGCRSVCDSKTCRGWKLDGRGRARMARPLRCIGCEPLVLVGRLSLVCGRDQPQRAQQPCWWQVADLRKARRWIHCADVWNRPHRALPRRGRGDIRGSERGRGDVSGPARGR